MVELMAQGSLAAGVARNLTIVVPAFNEDRHIATTLQAVLRAASRTLDNFEIIVVDDGSSDATGRIADETARHNPQIRVVHQPENRGVGAAFVIGLAEAQFEAITVVPGDNAFSEATLNNVFAAVGTAPLIVSYRANMEVRTPLRRLLSIACTWSMRLITGRWIRDAHSMFVYPVALARQIRVQPGYGYHIESLGRLLISAPSYREIPAILNPRPDANSGVMRFSVVALLVITMLRLALSRVGLDFPRRPGDGMASLGRTILIVCAVFAIVLAFVTGISLGLDKNDPSSRTRIHAIPVAISQIYHGRPHDYTADWSIALPFQSKLPLGGLIEAAVRAKVPPDDRTYYWTADDRGLSDFVNMAFRLFRPRIAALYYFWFFLLAGSLAVALACFRNDAPALLSIATTMITIDVILPAYIRAPAGGVGTSHISESRVFEILGAIAILHIALAIIRPLTVTLWRWRTTLALQIFFLTFLMHARSSIGWVFVVLLSIAAATAALRWWRATDQKRGVFQAITPGTMLIAGWVALAGYQAVMFNPAYRGEIGPRTFWHNILMGLSYNPTFAKDLKLPGVSDLTAVEAVLRDARARNDARLPYTGTAQGALNSLGSHGTFDWRNYELVARDLILREIAAHPLAGIRLALWDKPKIIFNAIICKTMLVQSVCGNQKVRHPNVRVVPFSWQFIVFLLALTGGYYLVRTSNLSEETEPLYSVLVATFWIALVGLLPSIIIYPGFAQLAGTMVFGILSIYLGLILIFSRLTRFMEAAWTKMAPRRSLCG